MLPDVRDQTVGHEMTERNVAQPQRNKRIDVAQRARRDHASHIGLRQVGLCALLGLSFGCATPTSRPEGGTKDRFASDAADAASGGCPIDCEPIGLACSLQRCTSAACQASEGSSEGIAGCIFYTLQPDNVSADENATTSFLVANAGQARANVTLEVAEAASGGTAWTQLGTFQIDVGASGRIPIDPASAPQVTAVGVTKKAALRLTSDQPVTVSEIESDNVDSASTSSGGTIVLPLQSLGVDHRVITYQQEPTNDVQATAGSRGGSARVMVVGTHDATLVTFKPVGPVTGDPSGDPPDIPAGGTHQVMLDDGDVFQIYSGAMGEDLTGAEVSASAPVAVFAGNISTTYGSNVTGINSADMAHEQMPPLSSWSKSYVAAAMTPQASIGCTSFFGMDGASIWRVLASHDGTQVKVAGTGITPATYPLDAGAFKTLVESGSFTLTANYPILVTQGIDCEPSLSLAVAVGATTLLTNLPFAVPPSFDLLLEVVRPTGAEILLDGTAISGAMFQAVGGGFDLASIPLAPCIPTDGSGVCTHLLIATSKNGGFGMSLRGMDVGSSFAFTTPLISCDPCLN